MVECTKAEKRKLAADCKRCGTTMSNRVRKLVGFAVKEN